MSEQQSSTQVGIIVVAHADYGSAMLRTAEFILGTLSDCTSISVDIAQEVPETVRRLDDAAQRLDKGAGVIILTDMFGGTPTNLALSLLGCHNVEVVTGGTGEGKFSPDAACTRGEIVTLLYRCMK